MKYISSLASRRLVFLLLILFLSACGSSNDQSTTDLLTAELVGAARVEITQVPDNVGCIQINVVGPARSVLRQFDVKTGQSSVLELNQLPIGEADFYGSAFDSNCDAVSSGATAGWAGGPVAAQLIPGVVAEVNLLLRANGIGVVTVDFEIDPVTGAPCVDADRAECLNPMDATGSADDPPPPGARMISPIEFGKGLKEGRIALNSAQIQLNLSQALAEEVKADRASVKRLMAERPEIAERLRRILIDPKEDNRLLKLGDDNYELTLGDEGPNGEPQKVVTMGRRFAYAETSQSLGEFFTQRNQLGVYVELFEALPEKYRLEARLPRPSLLVKWSADELLGLNLRIVKDTPSILELIPDIFTILPPPCSAEEGAPAVLTDQVGGSCSPSGSIWSNYDFPLKYRATCVKNQASRGTCVSFGISGAVEAAISKKHGRWVNLSEQRLYYRAKEPTAYGDGLNTSGTMVNAITDAFVWPFERHWDYNPSQSRIDTGFSYLNSCVGYSGEHCSDTAHQGDRVCVKILFWTFCGWDGSAPGSSGFRLTGSAQLFDFGVSTGVALGRLAAAVGVPLVMSFEVTPSFDNAGSNGVATYVGPFEGNRGGHAVAVLGQIDNSRLPEGIPAGAGGGYFIIKNSWGKCWKDGGYVYLPFRWVQNYAYSLRTVAGIN